MPIHRITDTLTGDGLSKAIRIDPNEEEAGSAIVGMSLSGTWSGVTATLKGCADPTASPQNFVPITDGAWTADVADALLIPIGWLVAIDISSSGSPLPNLNLVWTREVKYGGESE